VALSPIVLASACASIVSDNDSTTYIATEPKNAQCELQGSGFRREVATPASISLPADAAPISVTCEAAGFRQTSKDMDTSADGWIVGNILFGGIVGIAIDAARGAGQKYPEEFTVVLEPGSFESLSARDAWYDARRQEINEEWDEVARTIDNECSRNMKELCIEKKADAEDVRAQELEALEQRQKTAVVGIPDGNSNPQALNDSQGTTDEIAGLEPLPDQGHSDAPAVSSTGAVDASSTRADPPPTLPFDGVWILEVRNGGERDRVQTLVTNGRFSANFSANGWRGQLSGEINEFGTLTGNGTATKMAWGSRNVPMAFTMNYGPDGFKAKVITKGRVKRTFGISFVRQTASSSRITVQN
jgi:hypothetical protein